MDVPRFGSASLVVGYLVVMLGCANQSTISESASNPDVQSGPEQAVPVANEGPVTTSDREELLSGAGPVDDDAPQELMETTSGLKYRILRKTDGRKPTASDSVTVNYRGWLDDGTEFDSSYRRGEPISFPLTGVIAGWTEGMQLVGVGGMVELWIPSELGYGTAGAGADVPPNATLHFLVELLEVQ